MEFHKTTRAKHGINMVPLINIVLLLLIFFMLSTTLVAPEKFMVETPQSENSEEQAEVSLALTILKDGTIYLNSKMISIDILLDTFKRSVEENKNVNLLIKADANTTTKDVIPVLQVARTAGIENVALATQHPIKK